MPAIDTKTLAGRVKAVRQERMGANTDILALELGIPMETWTNYENGVTMPAHILLAFIYVTGANPYYLYLGQPCPMFSEKFDKKA